MDIRKMLREQAEKDREKFLTEGDLLFIQELLKQIPDKEDKKRKKKDKARRT
ncbi:MAG: hypothetical protein K2K80_06575 [Clostridia bacterium]|nr:hypothetical protein [Clostridia bacterium]